jgi:hypothetical protein
MPLRRPGQRDNVETSLLLLQTPISTSYAEHSASNPTAGFTWNLVNRITLILMTGLGSGLGDGCD